MLWESLPGQASAQLAPEAQLTEQPPVQVTWQVEPLAQLTLPLAPTVTAQLAELAQSMLQDWPQVPEQSLLLLQLREQLLPPQPLLVMSQAVPAGHEQLEPLQLAGCREPPQPRSPSAITNRKECIFIDIAFRQGCSSKDKSMSPRL
jgi:hypothetical protein